MWHAFIPQVHVVLTDIKQAVEAGRAPAALAWPENLGCELLRTWIGIARGQGLDKKGFRLWEARLAQVHKTQCFRFGAAVDPPQANHFHPRQMLPNRSSAN